MVVVLMLMCLSLQLSSSSPQAQPSASHLSVSYAELAWLQGPTKDCRWCLIIWVCSECFNSVLVKVKCLSLKIKFVMLLLVWLSLCWTVFGWHCCWALAHLLGPQPSSSSLCLFKWDLMALTPHLNLRLLSGPPSLALHKWIPYMTSTQFLDFCNPPLSLQFLCTVCTYTTINM